MICSSVHSITGLWTGIPRSWRVIGSNTDISMADADTIFYTNHNGGLGQSSAAGDVNGDGFTDITLAETGRVYLFLGSSIIQSEVNVASADLSVSGSNAYHNDSYRRRWRWLG